MTIRHIKIALLIACVVALCIVPGLLTSLFALFFIGMIPFTNYVVPPLFMLACYGVVVVYGVYWVAAQTQTISNPVARDIASRKRARKVILQKTAPKVTVSLSKTMLKRRARRTRAKASSRA